MIKVKLIKRNYIGEGYWHYFKDASGNVVREETNKIDYEKLGTLDGSKYNPVRLGLVWIYSAGGTIDVDTPTKELGDNEYVIVGDKVLVKITGKLQKFVPLGEIINDEIEIL